MKRILKYIRPYKGALIVSLILTAFNNGLQVLLPAMVSEVINEGVQNKNLNYIKQMGIVMVLTSLGAVILGVIASYFSSKAALGFGKELRRAIFKKSQELSDGDISDISTASLLIRNTNDVDQLQVILLSIIKMIVSAVIMMIGGTVMSFVINRKQSLLLLAVLVVIVVISVFIAMKMIPMYDIVQSRTDRLNQITRERLSGIRVVRAFNREKYEDDRFHSSSDSLSKLCKKMDRIYSYLLPVGLMMLFGIIVVLVYLNSGEALAMDVKTQYAQIISTVGNIQAFLMYILMIIAAIVMAMVVFVMIPKAMISVNRINDVLDREPSVVFPEESEEFSDRGTVRFDNVSFSYPGSDWESLKNVSFTAEKGKTTAIIGSTGSGKSTILSLLLRTYDVNSGKVLLGGTDIRKLTKEKLCSAVSTVSQKAVIFSGTVVDNIRFGKENITDEEVVRAAKTAQADEFIDTLENGYDTFIYQNGKNLSGGQKQRIAIARAIAKKSDIYIFDDSFSALDFKTDAKLREALKRDLSDKTVIIVAQRIGSIADADRIIVLANGNVVGAGTHEELSKQCTAYREIMRSQLSKERETDE